MTCRFERTQYLDILAATQASSGELAGKSIGDIYGAEHFCRLLGQSKPFRTTM